MQQLNFHENLKTLHVGTLPNHAYFIPHSSRESALTKRRANSDRFQLLSGEWDVTYYHSMLDLPEDFHYSYELWLEREVFSQPICWEELLQNH